MDVLNDNQIWVAGYHGTVAKTTDAGQNWDVLTFYKNRVFNYIKFFSPEYGVAAFSEYDYITGQYYFAKTYDGGKTWEKIFDFGDYGAYKLVNSESGKFYFITNNDVFTSADSGHIWTHTNLTSGNHKLTDIKIVKNGDIWIVSNEGKIFKMIESNPGWSEIHNADAYLDKIIPLDDTTTFVAVKSDFSVTTMVKILKTFDSGINWESVNTNLENIKEIEFDDVNNGYAYFPDKISKTSDGGLTWEMVNGFSEGSNQNAQVILKNSGVYYLNGNKIRLRKTSDLGANWQPMMSKLQGGGEKLVFRNGQIGFSGHNRGLNRTSDSGFSWTEVLSIPGAQVRDIEVISPDTIFAYSITGQLYKSFDAGITWSTKNTPAGYSMSFPTSKVGYLTTNDLYIFKTTDGGNFWSKEKTYAGLSHVWDSHFHSPTKGWICGGRTNTPGVVLQTTDGSNYNMLYSMGNQEFKTIKSLDLTTAWAMGKENFSISFVIKTEDAGESWEEVFRQYGLADFHLFNKNHVAIISEYGDYYETFDGGQNWDSTTIPMKDPRKIFGFNDDQIWIADVSGGIISTISEPIPVGVEDSENVDQEFSFSLGDNYPNPFNPTTTITFSIPEVQKVSLKVYNILGKELVILIDETLSAGEHNIKFNGTNLSSGIYFYQLVTPENSITKKMILVK
ncbi:MAG: hypothetical protein SCALA702_17980 [Melioribacteraceae bacterium]|nr:MAG: hypothetical protein SCALA702_17980 [Melioribacteraceae bacterium]